MASPRLHSWKEIAQYIGRDVSTAIRWERERGLPVHRVPGGKRGSVYALTEEIDRWLAGKDAGPRGAAVPEDPAAAPGATAGTALQASARGRGPWWIAAALLVVGATTLVTLVAREGGIRERQDAAVAAVAFSGTQLHALAEDGRVLWQHDFGRPVVARKDPLPDGSTHVFAWEDIDGDSRPELLVSVLVGRGNTNAPPAHDELYAFSADGRILWSHRLDDSLTFRAGQYGPPWRDVGVAYTTGRALAVYRVDGRARIAWAQCHHTWWPSILTVLDGSGRVISKWVHSGAIETVVAAAGPEGPRLLVGGISNSREAGFLAVLDGRQVEGAGPEDEGAPFECLSCGPGRPLRYFTLSPSELLLATAPYNQVYDVQVDSAGFEVHTAEASHEATSFAIQGISRFSPDFVLEHTSWSSAWDNRHRELELEGRLHHAAAQCPNRSGRPRVREWTPASGWHELTPADALAAPRTAQR